MTLDHLDKADIIQDTHLDFSHLINIILGYLVSFSEFIIFDNASFFTPDFAWSYINQSNKENVFLLSMFKIAVLLWSRFIICCLLIVRQLLILGIG